VLLNYMVQICLGMGTGKGHNEKEEGRVKVDKLYHLTLHIPATIPRNATEQMHQYQSKAWYTLSCSWPVFMVDIFDTREHGP